MKRTVSVMLMAVLVLGFGGFAAAGDFTLVPSTITGCGACTSPVPNVFGFTFLGTTFSRTDVGGDGVLSAGDSFTDVGALMANTLKSGPSSNILPGTSGLNVNWQLGATFSLPGTITSVSGPAATPFLKFDFTAGSKVDLYARPGLLMDNNDPLSITGGTKVATLSLIAGSGSLDFGNATASPDGTINLLLEFVDLPVAGFWKFLGVDIDLGTQLFIAITDSNNNVLTGAPTPTVASNFTSFFGLSPAAGNSSTLDNTWLSNDGSAEFQVTSVPNPSAFMMLGTALLGLGSLAALRRRA